MESEVNIKEQIKRVAFEGRMRSIGELLSYALFFAFGYTLVKGFIYLKPIAEVRLPHTDVELAAIYFGASVFLTFLYTRYLLSTMAECLSTVIGTTILIIRERRGAKDDWPQVIGDESATRRAPFGVERARWKYVLLAATLAFIVPFLFQLTIYGVKAYALTTPAAFILAMIAFNYVRVKRGAAE